MSGITSAPRQLLADIQQALEARLATAGEGEAQLGQAMRYAVLGQGKRLRPLLTLLTGRALAVEPAALLPAACAVEFMHAYSLIHDDLPAMDDDDLRRGRPSTHRAFDEATAILAGDALQSLAFETLTENPQLSAPQIVAQVRLLAQASGANGMAGGQTLDMAAEGDGEITLPRLQHIHELKTGCLISASVQLAAVCRDDIQPEQRVALNDFAKNLGLAFQVRDDLLDIQASSARSGKPQGSDVARGKATYPALMGLNQAQTFQRKLTDRIIRTLTDSSLPAGELVRFSQELLQPPVSAT